VTEAFWAWLGRVPFGFTAALQERLRQEVREGVRPEILLLCEHPPVVTLGRRARPEHVLLSESQLRTRGIEVHTASRGGGVTFHGPGQLVGYPVFRLRRGVLAHVESMAAAILSVLDQAGVRAEWRRACPGLWVGDEKVCAFGIHVRRGVAIHGFALNVTTDLGSFDHIVPCGIPRGRVTSIARLLGAAPDPAELVPAVVSAFEGAFGRPFSEALDPLAPAEAASGLPNRIGDR
jgi:lipoyl(octanoyl) transferase